MSRRRALTPTLRLKISYYKWRGKTQNWIARKTKVSIATINHYVNGNYPYKRR